MIATGSESMYSDILLRTGDLIERNVEIFQGSGYSLEDTDMVSWSKDTYGTSDSFITIDANGTVDLTPMYSGNEHVTLTLIVGTADQLDLNNIRYKVDIEISSIEDLLTFEAYTADESKTPTELYNFNNYFGDGTTGDEESYYQIQANPSQWKNGSWAYLGMSFGKTWKGAGLTASVQTGGGDKTGNIWSAASYAADWKRGGEGNGLTLVLSRGGVYGGPGARLCEAGLCRQICHRGRGGRSG